jgi:cytosine/adenosine deaminase-related metal-dependent hydrolase
MVIVDHGRIKTVLDRPGEIRGLPVIDTDGLILPGLIDLHNHVLWSVFPRWEPGGTFANRDVWPQNAVYIRNYSDPEHALSRTHGCDLNRFGEVKAISGGVTSVVGSLRSACTAGLVRNLDYDAGFDGERDERRAATLIDIDDLTPDAAAKLARRLGARDGLPWFVHVAEGRAEDPGPREEFARLVEEGLLTRHTVIVHGNGLGEAEFEAIAAAGASLVWSPRSNMTLYGETTSIAMALDRGIPVALGSDWSVTGSGNLLDELRYAAAWSRANLGGAVTDRQLVEMATSVPAAIAGIADRVGSIAPGKYADLLVIRGNRRDPYHAIVSASLADVRLVTVGGEALYGQWDVVQRLHSWWDVETLDVCGTRMALDTTPAPPSLLDRRYRFAATRARLQAALQRVSPGARVGAIAECR